MSSVKMMHYGINEKINLMITIVTDISQVTVCSKCSGYSSSSGQALDRMEEVVCHFFFSLDQGIIAVHQICLLKFGDL